MDKEKLIQNLKDANCDTDIIAKFFELENSNKVPEQIKLLSAHRKSLLDKLHKNQKCLDCLDYLIFNLEKEKKWKY